MATSMREIQKKKKNLPESRSIPSMRTSSGREETVKNKINLEKSSIPRSLNHQNTTTRQREIEKMYDNAFRKKLRK